MSSNIKIPRAQNPWYFYDTTHDDMSKIDGGENFLMIIQVSKIAALYLSDVIYGNKGRFIDIINNFL